MSSSTLLTVESLAIIVSGSPEVKICTVVSMSRLRNWARAIAWAWALS